MPSKFIEEEVIAEAGFSTFNILHETETIDSSW